MDDIDKFLNENFSKLEKKMEAKKNKTIEKITNKNSNLQDIKFNIDNTIGSEIYTSINFGNSKNYKIPPVT